LGAHGIVSLLDFHQDLYNEKFQGEGAPAWAVQDGGLLNPSLGFPGNYFANPALLHAFDQFWANAPGPDGVGLQDHLAAAWAHVAARFAADPNVSGYEVLNEPWPGTLWATCLVPLIGCPLFDSTLTAFYRRVVPAIRASDPAKTVWFEPAALFNEGIPTNLGTVADAHTGFAFHDYCGTEAELGSNLLCGPQDDLTFSNAKSYSTAHNIPQLLTEFGATDGLANLSDTVTRADKNRTGWLEWAYTGNDITSTSSGGQALVYDANQPPTGANVNTAKLKTLAEPYPQVVAGTPTSWSFSGGTFRLSYSTARAGGVTPFAAGSETDIAVPAIQFPDGYHVQVTGATVVSPPNATTLRLLSAPLALMITVTVTPAG
jgi:endoglycosylceramidase